MTVWLSWITQNEFSIDFEKWTLIPLFCLHLPKRLHLSFWMEMFAVTCKQKIRCITAQCDWLLIETQTPTENKILLTRSSILLGVPDPAIYLEFAHLLLVWWSVLPLKSSTCSCGSLQASWWGSGGAGAAVGLWLSPAPPGLAGRQGMWGGFQVSLTSSLQTQATLAELTYLNHKLMCLVMLPAISAKFVIQSTGYMSPKSVLRVWKKWCTGFFEYE